MSSSAPPSLTGLAVSSILLASLTAQQKVLGVNTDLLGRVLAFLGADTRDCFAATSVNAL